jgi:hypothetical protein
MIAVVDISDLNDEDRDTADALRQLLGQTFADRYIDFCRLTSGALPLRVTRPLAAHAIREFESSLRSALIVHGERATEETVDQLTLQQVSEYLSTLNFNRSAIDRALKALRPQDTHKTSIVRVLSWLGFEAGGVVAKAWMSLVQVFGRAHERSFHHLLEIDDEFRSELQQPFQLVVREVVRALRAKYSALMLRVEELTAMSDKGHAVALFEDEIPGAPPLQWHFFQRLDGDQWLPHLANKRLLRPPSVHAISTFPFGPWPAGGYLLRITTSADPDTRQGVVQALRESVDAFRPDVRSMAIEILAKLPADEATRFSSIVAAWLDRDARYLPLHGVEKLVTQLADSGEIDAALEIAGRLLQLFEDKGGIGTLYARSMYEYTVPRLAQALAPTCGTNVLSLFISLLRQAALITGKFVDSPRIDHTRYTVGDITDDQFAPHDVYSALTSTVRNVGEILVDCDATLMTPVLEALTSADMDICRRLALHLLARSPEAAPQLAEAWLMDVELMEAETDEYARLAIAWYPKLESGNQELLINAVRAIPSRYHDAWKARRGGKVSEEDEEAFDLLTVRDAVWKWRSVLPFALREEVEKTTSRFNEMEASRRIAGHERPEAPWRATDYSSRSTDETVDFIVGLRGSRHHDQPTLDALAQEWRIAVFQQPAKFALVAAQLTRAPAMFVTPLLEGLSGAVKNKISISWKAPLELIDGILQSDQRADASAVDTGWIEMAKASIELVKSFLLPDAVSSDPIDIATLRKVVLTSLDRIPREADAVEERERFRRDSFLTAKETYCGGAIELAIWWVLWISARESSDAEQSNTQALAPFDDVEFAVNREIADSSVNGEFARAIVGRYLPNLYYYAPGWVRENLNQIFGPAHGDVQEAAWSAYILHAWPHIDLYQNLQCLYEVEVSKVDLYREVDGGYRVKRLGEHLLLLYLYGSTPLADLPLEEFLAKATGELRRHLMWTVDQHLRLDLARFPTSARKRALRYWENRLEIASKSTSPDDFESELGTIGCWVGNSNVETSWLLDQLSQMLYAGFGPSMAFNVVSWLAKVCEQDIDKSSQILERLIDHRVVGHDTLLTQREAIRCILSGALACGRLDVIERANRIISVLATKGETDYLDLARVALRR